MSLVEVKAVMAVGYMACQSLYLDWQKNLAFPLAPLSLCPIAVRHGCQQRLASTPALGIHGRGVVEGRRRRRRERGRRMGERFVFTDLARGWDASFSAV